MAGWDDMLFGNLPPRYSQLVEDRANKTADVRGLSPAEALSQFIRGKKPLGLGGAGAATLPLWQQYQRGQQGGGYGQPSA